MPGAIRVRNKHGEMIDAPEYTASEAKHKFGQLLDTALRQGPVAITKRHKPTAVLISIEEYRVLTQSEDRALAALSAEFDRRYATMQAPGAAAAMQRAFDTAPAQLGAFAIASLRKKPSAPTKTSASPRKRG
jgi:prevent-host-death family protein